MADRRMLTKKVTDDDNFMALSASAQALYLHLSMGADDDGFCNQVSISMFKAHASVADLEQLLEKRYIYQFDDGVIVIKHWRMANALRKDRYTPTVFQEDLSKLDLKPNGSYTMLPNGCQMVATCLPQDRLDKDRLGKDRLGKDRVDCKESNKSTIDYQKIVEAFNSTCISYPQLKVLSDNRKKAIKARLNTYSEADLMIAFEKAENSDFLKGKNSKNWSANFDWIMKDANLAKILEGNYDNKNSNSIANTSAGFYEGLV